MHLIEEHGEFAPVGGAVGPADAGPADDERQRPPLHEQGDDRDREGDEHELLVVRGVPREGLGGREGDDAAHPGPTQHDPAAPAEPFGLVLLDVVARLLGAAQEPHDPACRARRPLGVEGFDPFVELGRALGSACRPLLAPAHEVEQRPDEPEPQHHEDAGEQHAERDRLVPGEVALLDLADDPGELGAHEQEDAVLEHELEGAPVEPFGDARLRGEPGALVARVDAGGDDGDDSGGVQLFGRDVGDERHGERDGGVEDRLVQAAPDEDGDEADDQSERGRDDDGVGEVAERSGNVEAARHRERGRRDRGAQQHEGGGVVDETLAFEDREQARRQAEPFADRGRGDDIGRADDRAEGDGGGEVEVFEDDEQHESGEERAADDEQHREGGDRSEVAAEVDDRQLDRGGVEQQGQDAGQDEFRFDLDRGHAGDEAVADPDQHEQEGGGDAESAREGGGRDDQDDSADGDEGEVEVHGLQAIGRAAGLAASTSLCARCAPRRRTGCRSGRRCSPGPR